MTPARRVFEEKRHLIFPLIGALIVNVVLFVIVVYPLSRKVAAGEESARTANIGLTAARREFQSANNTVKSKLAADAELKKFYSEVLPPDQSAARRITYLKIYQVAKKANVAYERGSNEATQERESALGKLSTTVVLSGQYRDIRRLIHELETAPEFLILESVALSQGSDAGSPLNVTVKLATYYQAGADGI